MRSFEICSPRKILRTSKNSVDGVWQGPQIFPKSRKHLQTCWGQKGDKKQVNILRTLISAATCTPRFLTGAGEVKRNFICRGQKETENNHAENLWQHCTKFSHLADHAPGICAPLVHCHSRD